jgi:hypothetical protein
MVWLSDCAGVLLGLATGFVDSRTVTEVLPTCMTDPWPTVVGVSTGRPPNKVPLREPKSSTNHDPLSWKRRACIRDIERSGIVKSAFEDRPMTKLSPSSA